LASVVGMGDLDELQPLPRRRGKACRRHDFHLVQERDPEPVDLSDRDLGGAQIGDDVEQVLERTDHVKQHEDVAVPGVRGEVEKVGRAVEDDSYDDEEQGIAPAPRTDEKDLGVDSQAAQHRRDAIEPLDETLAPGAPHLELLGPLRQTAQQIEQLVLVLARLPLPGGTGRHREPIGKNAHRHDAEDRAEHAR
jgi:hypothetical protein